MSTKGTPVYSVRIPADLGDEIERTIRRRNDNTSHEPYLFGGFCLAAIREKIAKMKRSRRPRKSTEKSVVSVVVNTPTPTQFGEQSL